MCDLSPVRKQLYGSYLNVRERANLRDEKRPRNISFGAKSGPPPISPEKRVNHSSYSLNLSSDLSVNQCVTPTTSCSSQKVSQVNLDDYKKYFLKLKRPLDFSLWIDKVYSDIDNSKRLGAEEKTQYRKAVKSLCIDDLKKIYQVLKKEYEQSQRDQLLDRNKNTYDDMSYLTEKYTSSFSNNSPHKQYKGKDQYEFGKTSNWETASPSREHLLAERLDHSISEKCRGKSSVFKTHL